MNKLVHSNTLIFEISNEASIEMPKKIILPKWLLRLMRTRDMTLEQAHDFVKKHGFKVSIGWLSMHKDLWKPKRKRELVFREEDKYLDSDLAKRIMLFRGKYLEDMSEKKHFTAKDLEKFTEKTPEACSEFAKQCLVWKGKPIELQDYQLKMIEGWLGPKPTVYPIGRGGGKDFTLAIFLTWYLTVNPGTRAIVICPAQRQVKTFIHENLALLFQTSGVLYDSIEKFIEEEFRLTNGSVVFTYGATSFIKGKHHIDFIFCNEAAEIPEHVFENVLLPMLGSHETKGHLSIIGVPGGQQGYFWKAYQNSSPDINDPKAKFYRIQLPTEVNKYYSKEQLEMNRRLMSHDVFLQEHMAQFLDIEGALFTQQIIDMMKEDYDTRFGIVDNKKQYYAGIDWGRTGSYTVVVILSYNLKEKSARVEYIQGMRKAFPEQLAWIKAADNIYNFKCLMVERMGLGIPPSDELRKDLGSRKVKYFIPSAKLWFDAFTHLRDAAVNNKLVIPASELKLISQLRLLSFKVKGEHITVKSEGKDDYAQALAIAYWAIKKRGRAGVAGKL